MGFMDWMDSKTKNLDGLDIQLIKLSVFFFTLMLAKLWAPLLSLEWYWYALVFVLAGIKPIYDVFKSK
jgi:hypothetical protein